MNRTRLPPGNLVWVLLASIALNLFFGGWLGARAARDQLGAEPKPAGGSRIEQLAETLPTADGDRLRASFAAEGDGIGTLRANFRQAQEAVRVSLRAQPYDAAAFEQATATMRERRLALEVALHRALSRAARDMTPDGRVQLAKWPPQH